MAVGSQTVWDSDRWAKRKRDWDARVNAENVTATGAEGRGEGRGQASVGSPLLPQARARRCRAAACRHLRWPDAHARAPAGQQGGCRCSGKEPGEFCLDPRDVLFPEVTFT